MITRTTKQGVEYHRVAKKDRARIQCYAAGCCESASVIEHAHWNTGNTKGLSFWSWCAKHWSEKTHAKTTCNGCGQFLSTADVERYESRCGECA